MADERDLLLHGLWNPELDSLESILRIFLTEPNFVSKKSFVLNKKTNKTLYPAAVYNLCDCGQFINLD